VFLAQLVSDLGKTPPTNLPPWGINPANSMANFSFNYTMLAQGTTFIFDPWVYIVNSSGGFDSHLANSREPEASSARRSNTIGNQADNLNEILLPDLAKEIKENSFSTRVSLAL
jgi:hypothetical protein